MKSTARPAPRALGTPITAVVVTRGRSDYLPRCLVSLAEQTRPAERVVLVDVAENTDPVIGEMALRCGIPADSLVLVHARSARNFGRAVAAGLQGLSLAANERIFLLHDDVYAAPDCLATLARAVEFAPSVVIAGPKQLRVDLPSALGEVGVKTSRFGRRMTGAEDGELDQGQYDHREDMLGVGTAGMLVRADAWAELGGLDPAMGPFRDGLDLSRRARLAGHRVIVVPAAVVHHEQASFRGLRGRLTTADARRSFGARRRAFIYTQLVHCPVPLMPLVAAAAVIAGFGRALWRLASKDLDLIVTELVAPMAVLARPERLFISRRLARQTRRLRRATLRPLQTTFAEVRAMHRDRRLARAEAIRVAEAPSEVELADRAVLARARRRARLVVWLVAGLVTLACLGQLIGRGHLAGGALVNFDLDWTTAWQRAVADWIPAGLGHRGPADPMAWILAAAQTISWGHGVMFLLVLAPLVSALGAWYASGAAARSVLVRLWVALVYLASPALWSALSSGRLGAVVTHAVLPWVFLTAARAAGKDRRDLIRRAATQRGAPTSRAERSVVSGRVSLGDAAMAGLLLGVAVAGTPLLLPLALAALLVAFVVTGWQWRLLVAAVLPLISFARLIAAAWQDQSWRILLADPGQPLASETTPIWRAVLGWPAEPVVPLRLHVLSGVLLAVSALVVVAALAALCRRGGRGAAIRLGWVVVLLGAGGVWFAGRCLVASTGSELVTPWAGGAVSLLTAGLLMAASSGADGAGAWLVTVGGARRAEAAVLAAVMMAGPVLILASAVWQWRADREIAVERVAAPDLPAIAALNAAGDDATSTLVMWRQDRATAWRVVRGNGLNMDDAAAVINTRRINGSLSGPQVSDPDTASRELSALVAGIAAGGRDGVWLALAEAGIGFCFVPSGNKALAAALDATEGLSRTAETSGAGVAWRVGDPEAAQRAAWLRLAEADGSWIALAAEGTVVPEGSGGRTLLLAEAADGGWHANLGNTELAGSASGWQQSFAVPSTGGKLTVWRQDDPLVGFQLAVLALSLVVAVPLRRRRGAEEN